MRKAKFSVGQVVAVYIGPTEIVPRHIKYGQIVGPVLPENRWAVWMDGREYWFVEQDMRLLTKSEIKGDEK